MFGVLAGLIAILLWACGGCVCWLEPLFVFVGLMDLWLSLYGLFVVSGWVGCAARVIPDLVYQVVAWVVGWWLSFGVAVWMGCFRLSTFCFLLGVFCGCGQVIGWRWSGGLFEFVLPVLRLVGDLVVWFWCFVVRFGLDCLTVWML